MKKLRVAILYGGKSAEHEISILSAMQIIESLDKKKYDLVPIYIDKKGKFPFEKLLSNIDVVFPVLHGPFGEDGTMQGFLEILGLPYVGCGVASSAIAMDKELTKKILLADGIKTANFLVARSSNCFTFAQIEKELRLPFFIKPVHLGSSIGIAKVENEEQFLPAVEEALSQDSRILFEEMIDGREIECSVLGVEQLQASLPGEIILPKGAFYDTELKTTRAGEIGYAVPAQLDPSHQKQVQELSLKAFQSIRGKGMARVDFFLTPGGELYLNEINPIPGFTKTSLYPQMWAKSGLDFPNLLDQLISISVNR